ncbi:hypothetical protein FRC01_002349, partial [Tulasnella sp. 417]
MSAFVPGRSSHSHTSSFDSASEQTTRRGTSEFPIIDRAASDQNTRSTLPDLVDRVLKRRHHLSESFIETATPTPAFRADNRLQEECIQHFLDFAGRIHDLEDRIHDFTRAVRPLGSSSGLIFSAIRVRRRMTEIQDVFYANAAAIYVAFGEKPGSELPLRLRRYSPAKSGRQAGSVKDFPDLLTGFASELREFLYSLCDIPEFSDKALTDSIEGLATWLEYRANGLQDFGTKLKTPALKRYTNGLMLEMGKYLKQMGDALNEFRKDGVAAIRIAQDRSREQLLNMSTVATFFSGVAATTFQYTSGNRTSTLDELVRALWVSSLILSIASAINSQLAMHWRTAMYRSPRSALPMWTSICLNQTPLLFLVFAVLTFSLGLVIYTYSSSQGKMVTLCATILTSFTSLILLTVILWEGGERWQASKTNQGKEEMGPGVPVAHQTWEPYEEIKRFNLQVAKLVWRCTRWTYSAIQKPFGWLFTVFPRLPKPRRRRSALAYYLTDTPLAKGLPTTMVLPMVQTATLGGVQWNASTVSVDTAKCSDDIQQHWQILSPPGELRTGVQGSPASQDTAPFSPIGNRNSPEARRFYDTAWHLVRDPKARDLLNLLPMAPEGAKTLKSLKRVDHYTPQEGKGPVQDLHFAPNGKWIAASFNDGTVGLWRVESGLTWSSHLAAQQGGIVWDHKLLRLLVPQKGGVELWDGESPQRKIRVKSGLEAFTWLPDGQKFVAVKDNSLYILNMETGGVQRQHHIMYHPLRVHDMASIPSSGTGASEFIIMVCTIQDDAWNEEGHEGLLSFLGARWQRVRPKDVQPQRRIIIYDITRSTVAAEVPVWGDCQHVSVSRNGRFALLSYGSTAPPELWHIGIPAPGNVNLELCHIYHSHPKLGASGSICEFVGRAAFGGDSDEYVVATTK